MSEIFLDKDIDLKIIQQKKISIIGYGNQGRAQALNLRDSGINIRIGLRIDSNSIPAVKKDNLKYLEIKESVDWADIICLLVPDKKMPEVFTGYIKENLNSNKTILFSHGFNIHYKQIEVSNENDVIMVAPSAGGKIVRSEYKKGYGVPSLIAVHNDSSGSALELAKAYAKAIGSGRVCIFKSTFKEETETDIFGEQAILTGGLPFLINQSFNTLVDNGYSPIVAWFVCYYEIKTIVDLFHDIGFEEFYDKISDTARIGGIISGSTLIDNSFIEKLKFLLKDIESGSFYKKLNTDGDKKIPDSFKKIEEQTRRIFEKIKG